MAAVRLIIAETERALAEQAARDLRSAGHSVEMVWEPERDAIAIAVMSQAAFDDARTYEQVEAALDAGQHVVFVAREALKLPRTVDHLPVIDYTSGSGPQTLRETVTALSAEGARLPLKVRTASVRRANRQAGIIVGAIVLFMFAVGLYGVGVLGIQAPREEYNAVETEAALTRDFLAAPELAVYARFLPGNAATAAAVDYQPTLNAVPTVYRPLMALTATAYAGYGYQLVTPTPLPTTTPEG
ncbi:MAG: hypothetical protein ACUVS2_15355 [Candidatus Flexifilum sp.]|jgi:hypothetical protein